MIKILEKLEDLDKNTWWYKELTKLGCNMERATKVPGSKCSFYDIYIDDVKLKQNGYKYIKTTSHDDTSASFTNGKYVVTEVAIHYGFVSITTLGPKAKAVIDSDKPFDIHNNDFED